MRVKLYFLSVVIFLFLTSFLYSQDEERWSKPKLRLEPVQGANQEEIKIDLNVLQQELQKIHPIRTITKDKTYTVYPNIRVWPNAGMTQSEVHIAHNPNNPNILLGGSNAANNSSTVTYVNQGVYVTTNGGQTWFGTDSLPGIPSGFYRSDPVVAFDHLGNMYFNTLEYSSTAGDLVTLKSTNNGLTWPIKVAVPNPGIDEDKNWIAIDVNPSSPYRGYIYTAYTEFQTTDPNYRRLEFSRSTDGGLTFSAPINMSGTAGYLHQGVNLAVGTNGDVVAAFTHYPTSTLTTSHVAFARSTDGGLTWTQQLVVQNINDIRGNLTKGGNTIRVNSFPYIAVDHSNGPRRGWIYITYAARPATGQPPDVYLVRSTNFGQTWSTPIKVNSEPANRDQWFPAIAVDPADGSVNIVYYDSRNYPNNDSTEVYLSRSLDGGVTWEDIKVSDRAFLPRAIAGLATGYMGDYIGITARNGVVWPFWNDNRLGYHQAYTAKVFFIQINHTKLPNTENLNGPYTVRAKITGSVGIQEAKVFWRRGTTGAFDSLLMTRVAADSFVANIPGNGLPAIYQYYIYARDSVGSFATLPGGAPQDIFQFEAAADNQPPVITHTVLGNQYRELWPPQVTATVTDNIGVDSVWVVFKVNTPGTLRQFRLNPQGNNQYAGSFNISSSQLNVGDTIYYRIIAKDLATNPNFGYHPSSTGFNSFRIIPDTEFPVINHTALRDQPFIRWPAVIRTNVTDNIGVDSVWVEWYKNTPANPRRFNLVNLGNNNWEAPFNSDTSQVAIGDSIFYRVVARDISLSQNITYLPTSGYYKFRIIQTRGLVLVIDDDVSELERISPEKGQFKADLTAPLGASANLFKATLDSLGYLADLVTFANFDTSQVYNYDIVILSAGAKTSSIFNDQGKRDAIRRFAALDGKKTWVEGGEVGYFFRSTGTNDQLFRQQVLFTDTWVSDATTATLVHKLPTHPINTTPNAIPNNVAFTGTGIGVRDAMRVLSGARVYPVSAWSSHPDSGGVIVRDKTPNPTSADNIFFTFNIAAITDQSIARRLIENTAEYLMAREQAPLGRISGTVTLQGATNHGGVTVVLTGTANKTTVTAANGSYSFDSLYNGPYRVTVNAPANWFPYTQFKDTSITSANHVSGINFTFVPLVKGTISGQVLLQGQTNHSGILVQVINQPGKEALTNASGNYQITDVNPGQVIVRFSKQGYGSQTRDTVLANGGSLVLNTTLTPSLGNVLIIDDDVAEKDRINPEKPGEVDLTTPLGASATLFKSVLDSLGYNTTLVSFASLDTSTLNNYELVILSTGSKSTNIFNDAGKRAAIRRYATTVGKTLVEGGEVGYFFRSTSTTADSMFRKEVLHTGAWVSDATTSTLRKRIADHPIWNVPNLLPDNIAFTGTSIYTRDAMRVDPAPKRVYHAGTYSAFPDSGSIVVHDKNANPASADNIFFTFNIAQITDQSLARRLIENTVKYLFNVETAPLGRISGTVTLQGAPNSGGVEVRLSGTVSKVTYTAPNGAYSFDSLYAGPYRITAIAPTGWFPYQQVVDTTVSAGQQISNINFTFVPLVTGTISGQVQLQGQTNHSGVEVRVLNQPDKVTTTNAAGNYTLTGVNPGNLTVQFKKQGFKTTRRDVVLPNGGSVTVNVTMPVTLGNILVIDDDVSYEGRVSNEKNGTFDLTSPLGASANLFKATLDSLGYNADLVSFNNLDTTILMDYDLLLLTAGPKTGVQFNNQALRDAIRKFANTPGKKTWVEGGEVGYAYRSTGTNDQLFRQQVLFTNTWISDVTSGLLNKRIASHPINSNPNLIPDNLAFAGTGIGERDAMTVMPGARVYPVSAWSTLPDSGGIIVNDKNANPLSADNVFFTFNIAGMTDQSSAKKLIENTAKYLFTYEPPPTGAISGTVSLSGSNTNAGVTVKLYSLPGSSLLNTVVTDSTGRYIFGGLYSGLYRVEATPPTGFYPAVATRDTSVGTDTVKNFNFTFINVNTPQSVTFSTTSGWNLLSVPVKLTNMSKGNLFPNSVSNAFNYSDDLGYIKHDTLRVGSGYWLKFNQQQQHTFQGPVDYVLNIPVKRGWNLIGAAYKSVPVASVSTTPAGIIQSPFFEYSGNYSQATNLVQGKGYWVKVSQNGTLTLRTTYPKELPKNIYVETIDEKWPSILITDADGQQMRLYLTTDMTNYTYELPPVPPNGAFDVRFNTDKYVEDASVGNYVISLNSVKYPIQIKLENFEEGATYKLTDGFDGRIYEDIIRNGEVKEIANAQLTQIQIAKVEIPKQFELSQNYPNPFNPSTIIKFGLPENSRVKLEIYNVLGERVATLINSDLKAGYYVVNFDASNLTSGIYFYRIETSNWNDVKKMILIK
ncbi:MAG: carboxypeptidase regulatory-like domain-containing protein [Ignavibacteria bacterium]|nr:carboxypeptidase regulatory-like domain-containing protein [Ignavibacteria bacterium]